MGEVFAARYELADPIGRGGVGAVWRAWDHRRRRYVAAKVLQQSDAHALLRFVREQALRIDHPHVLAPASWAADDDKVLFTMDLVAGGSLVHLVGDYGPLPPRFVCTLVDQLLSGLSAVHAEGVVHRDIKPANILLEATGTARPRLRLSDFGIAMRLGEPRLTETNLVVGTPGYLAPEQMMGAEPDFPADLFAVGLVALYLLEGAKPDAKSLLQYFAEQGTPAAPKGVPEPLWQVVATLLQPDPQARFRTATGARKALAAAVELLSEPGPDDEPIEIFDQLGPLPEGFGPQGPAAPAPGVAGTPSPFGPTPSRQHTTGGSVPARPDRDPLPAWPGTHSVTPGTPAPPPGPPSVRIPPSAPVPLAWAPAPPAGPGPGAAAVPHGTGADDAVPSGSSLPGGPGAGVLPAPAAPPGSSDPRHITHSPTNGPDQPLEASSAGPGRSLSDTGSFPLPPPLHPGTAPRPAPGPASDTTFVLPPRSGAERRVEPSTASYTAQDPQTPPPSPPLHAPPADPDRARRGGHRRARAVRRPGPPARVTVPVLLLALACYAVGFWALARI